MSQADLARALEVTEAAVSRWLSEVAMPSRTNAERLAGVLGVSVDWLLGLPDRRPAGPTLPSSTTRDDWHPLPKVVFAAAGEPIHDLPASTLWYVFHRSWIVRLAGRASSRDEQRFVVVEADKKHVGKSMIPMLRPGAVLLVDRGPGGRGIAEAGEIKQGGLYIVQLDGGLTVKRVFRSEETLTLISDNPDPVAYPPRTVPLRVDVLPRLLVGRVVWLGQAEL